MRGVRKIFAFSQVLSLALISITSLLVSTTAGKGVPNGGKAPYFLKQASIIISSDNGVTWKPVPGHPSPQNQYLDRTEKQLFFEVTLDPLVTYYFLDILHIQTKTPLANGYYPFQLEIYSVPLGYYQWWADRGLTNEQDNPLLWLIIHGNSPMFYLLVETDATGQKQYMLVDGYLKDSGQGDHWLRVNGDYPLGTYRFWASLDSQYWDTIIWLTLNAPTS